MVKKVSDASGRDHYDDNPIISGLYHWPVTMGRMDKKRLEIEKTI